MKPNGLETTALLVAAAGLGTVILAGTVLWKLALIGGLAMAIGSYMLRKGWHPTP